LPTLERRNCFRLSLREWLFGKICIKIQRFPGSQQKSPGEPGLFLIREANQ
jgi:hypothetical protein